MIWFYARKTYECVLPLRIVINSIAIWRSMQFWLDFESNIIKYFFLDDALSKRNETCSGLLVENKLRVCSECGGHLYKQTQCFWFGQILYFVFYWMLLVEVNVLSKITLVVQFSFFFYKTALCAGLNVMNSKWCADE